MRQQPPTAASGCAADSVWLCGPGPHAPACAAPRVAPQLDWSKDGQITFREYLVGMERIIIEVREAAQG